MRDSCPNCKSSVYQILTGPNARIEFSCGSVMQGFGMLKSSSSCSVIASLRNRILTLEKWQTVVFHKLDLTFDETGSLVWQVRLPVPENVHSKSIQDAFDEEVKRELKQ